MCGKDDDVGIDPFAAALADMVGNNLNPEAEDALEGELDGLLFDDEEPEELAQLLGLSPEVILTPEGTIGVDED